MSLARSPAVQLRFAIHHNGHIAAATEELHHFFPGAGQLRPARTGGGVLLQAANSVAFHNEINLTKTACGSLADGIAVCAKHDDGRIVDEDLAPDVEERLLEGRCHLRGRIITGANGWELRVQVES